MSCKHNHFSICLQTRWTAHTAEIASSSGESSSTWWRPSSMRAVALLGACLVITTYGFGCTVLCRYCHSLCLMQLSLPSPSSHFLVVASRVCSSCGNCRLRRLHSLQVRVCVSRRERCGGAGMHSEYSLVCCMHVGCVCSPPVVSTRHHRAGCVCVCGSVVAACKRRLHTDAHTDSSCHVHERLLKHAGSCAVHHAQQQLTRTPP